MRHFVLVSTLALLLAACGETQDADAPTQAATVAADATPNAAAASAGAPSPTSDAVPAVFKEDAGDSWTFEYSWPGQVSAIAELAQEFAAMKEKARTQSRREWDQAQKDEPDDCGSCRNRSYEEKWAVVADLPQFLSLSSEKYFYGGGAHGMSGFDTVIWDRQERKLRDPLSLFTSDKAFAAAVRPAFCKALDAERAKRRSGEAYDAGVFDDCVDPLDTTVILGSANGRTFDRVGFLMEPYLAGPYAEGTYEVTLPVGAALLALVKPDYRTSFSARR